jgi:integrase
VGEITVAYEADLRARQARGEVSRNAVADFRRRLFGFVEQHGDLPASELREHHVAAWLDSRTNRKVMSKEGGPPPPPKPIGPTSRHDGVAAVKAITAWAKRRGSIPVDPLGDMRKPKRPPRRELIIDARRLPEVLAKIPPGPFADLFRFLYQTGARPGEAMALEAKHLDAKRRIATLKEHKTRHLTDRPRVIPLSVEALALVTRLAKEHPTGPLFRNARGRPWTKDAINNAVRRLRGKLGVGLEFVAYAMRHGFASDALAKGVPIAVVAEMLGHSDTRTLSAVYAHLTERTELLADAADMVRSESKNPP